MNVYNYDKNVGKIHMENKMAATLQSEALSLVGRRKLHHQNTSLIPASVVSRLSLWTHQC